jgi:DNA-binding transcriptional regulator GbsR (MarR family)
MTLKERKEKFVQSWGAIGSNWGINRTMAQIHALLLIAEEPMNAQDIKEELKISVGNANMNIRALIDWGLVHKELIPGERKEYFVAEKDMWEVLKRIIIQRKKKELEPILKVLTEISDFKAEDEASEEFINVIKELEMYSHKVDSTLDTLIKADSNWFVGTFMKLIR